MKKIYLLLILLIAPLLMGASSSVNFGVVGQLGAFQGSGWKTDLTFTVNGFNVTGFTAEYRYVGDTMEVRGKGTISSTVAATASISLPSGITIDTAKVNANDWLGRGNQFPAATTNLYTAGNAADIFYDGSTTDRVFFTNASTSSLYQKINGSSLWGSNAFNFWFSFPVYGRDVGGGGSGSAASTNSDYSIFLSHPTGYGATNTMIRTFGRVVKNTASGYINLTQSSSNGDSLTAVKAGLYAACYGDSRTTSNASVAITVDDQALTTTARTPITWAQGMRALYVGVSTSDYMGVCDIFNLNVGQVVRAHSDGNNSATDQNGYFYMYYIGDQSPSSLFLSGGNGYGSSNTLIRRWVSPAVENTGTAFTVADSSTAGMTVTINEDGRYWMCRGEGNASSSTSILASVTVNDATLTNTTPYSYTWAQGLRLTSAQDINYYTSNTVQCGFFKFSAGDIIRGHDYSSGLANGTNAQIYLRIIKLPSAAAAVANTGGVSGVGSVSTKLRYFGTLNYQDAGISWANSTPGGSAFIAPQPGVYGACANEYASVSQYPGIVVNPRLPTTDPSSTQTAYNDGFRGMRRFGGGSSSSNHCAFEFLNSGGQMYEQAAGAGGTDTFIYMHGARLY